MPALDLYLRSFQPDILNVTGYPYTQHSPVYPYRLRLSARLFRRAVAVLLRLQVCHLHTGVALHPLLLESLLRERRDLHVFLRKNAIQDLRHRHLGGHVGVEAGELHADGAGTDDEQRLRHDRRDHRFAIGPDQLPVGLQLRQRPRPSTGRQDDMLGGQIGHRLSVLFNPDLAFAVQPAVAVDHGDLVLLQQVGDAARKLLRYAARPLHHLAQIEADILRAEAMGVEILQDVVDLRRAEQRFGGDAAPVQADAAEMLALDHRRLHAKLCGSDGRDIAAGAAADDDQVEAGVCHAWLLLVRRPLRTPEGR